MKFPITILLVIALMAAANQRSASAQSGPGKSTDEEQKATYWNLSAKTMGGKQFWSDYVFFHGYRIQKNVVTGHHRLLDPKDMRLAWGGFQGCQNKLNEIAEGKKLQPMTGRVLIVMHGLTRTRSAMNSITEHIENNSEIHVINVAYASTRTSIDQHATALASIIDHMPQVTEFNFLGHSMGNIVVRYYLGTTRPGGDPRFKRMVMLAPPNNGSRLALKLQNNLLFKTFWGVSGQQLSRGWSEIESQLATPSFEFGIIAGSQPDDATLNNPLLSGKNDLVVSVEETRLAGARDFYQQHLLHSTMMNQADVHRVSLSFLENGYFQSEEQRTPIAAGRSQRIQQNER